MFVPVKIDEVPSRKSYAGKNIEELQNFLDSGLRAAQYILPEGANASNKIACFQTAVKRKGFPIILSRQGDHIFFIRKEE